MNEKHKRIVQRGWVRVDGFSYFAQELAAWNGTTVDVAMENAGGRVFVYEENGNLICSAGPDCDRDYVPKIGKANAALKGQIEKQHQRGAK